MLLYDDPVRWRAIIAGGFACAVLLLPQGGIAAESISRGDGFLLIWQSIRRPVEKVAERAFLDVGHEHPDFPVITYAKARGIFDDGETFRPDDPLMLPDALLWLLRTRNADDPDAIALQSLPHLLTRYPLGDFLEEKRREVPLSPRARRRTGKETRAVMSMRIRDRAVSEEDVRAIIDRLDALLAEEVHEVSFYAENFHGRGTAFGERFDMRALTAAHRTFPHHTLVRVMDVESGRSVVVRINDRGPYVPGRDMDLSLAAFERITERSRGKISATFQRLGDSRLVAEACMDPTRDARGTGAARERRARRVQQRCARPERVFLLQ